jgi:hypothetical protein
MVPMIGSLVGGIERCFLRLFLGAMVASDCVNLDGGYIASFIFIKKKFM